MTNWFGGTKEHMFFFQCLQYVRLREPVDVVHSRIGVLPPKHFFFDRTPECRELVFDAEVLNLIAGGFSVRTLLQRWQRNAANRRVQRMG